MMMITSQKMVPVLLLSISVVAAAAFLPPSDAASSASRHCRFPAIYNFGDSNSDTGGYSAVFSEFDSPYGSTFFHHPAGRASDGRLIIDFIAERLGVPYLNAYLDSFRPNFTHGVNFATGGSTILPTNTTLDHGGASPISLTLQSRQFTQFQTRSLQVRNQGGVCEPSLPDQKVFSQALYTFDIGQNDLSHTMNMSTDQVKSYIPDLLRKLSDVIKDCYAKGARTFWIHNTGPLGCLPSTLVRFPASQLDEHGCSKPHNDVAQFFNMKLMSIVDELQNLLPLASLKYVDIYTLKYFLISNAKNLGFDDPLLVCCGYGENKYNYSPFNRCGHKQLVNGTDIINSCKKPKRSISWDGIHYTEAANKWVFDHIVNDLC